MQSILEHYESDIVSVIANFTKDNVVEIVIFSIRYVESNGTKLSNYLGVVLSGEFKKSLAITFITHLLTDSFSEEMLGASIDTLHRILFPKIFQNIQLSTPLENNEKKKVKKNSKLFFLS